MGEHIGYVCGVAGGLRAVVWRYEFVGDALWLDGRLRFGEFPEPPAPEPGDGPVGTVGDVQPHRGDGPTDLLVELCRFERVEEGVEVEGWVEVPSREARRLFDAHFEELGIVA